MKTPLPKIKQTLYLDYNYRLDAENKISYLDELTSSFSTTSPNAKFMNINDIVVIPEHCALITNTIYKVIK